MTFLGHLPEHSTGAVQSTSFVGFSSRGFVKFGRARNESGASEKEERIEYERRGERGRGGGG